ncbi:MAG: hypothetical protein V2B20_10345, partial [Pseudomonadota bacterium]
RGKVARIARVTADTRPGVLVAEGIFWPVDDDDAAINDLTSQKLSDMGGGATFHETLVAIALGKEEYNARLSLIRERLAHSAQNGEAVPLDTAFKCVEMLHKQRMKK